MIKKKLPWLASGRELPLLWPMVSAQFYEIKPFLSSDKRMQTGFTEMRSRYTGAARLRARLVVAGTSPRLICTVVTGLKGVVSLPTYRRIKPA